MLKCSQLAKKMRCTARPRRKDFLRVTSRKYTKKHKVKDCCLSICTLFLILELFRMQKISRLHLLDCRTRGLMLQSGTVNAVIKMTHSGQRKSKRILTKKILIR